MCNYNKNPEVNNLICEAVGCVARATDKIRVKAGAQKAISLLLCNECISKFQTSIEARDESSYQSKQYKDEILESHDECLYWYRQCEDVKAELEQLKAEHSSGSQNKKMVLEEVGSPESNISLRSIFSDQCGDRK